MQLKCILFLLLIIGCKSDVPQIVKDINNLRYNHDYIFLSIGRKDCDICQKIITSDYYQKLPLGKVYIDILENNFNRLLSQAMYTYGFPTNYIINSELELLGFNIGAKDINSNIDSIYMFGIRKFNDSILDIDNTHLLDMLTFSLKSLMCYWEKDIIMAEKYALESLSKGSYFFNNYMLYLISKKNNDKLSMIVYKKNALFHTNGVNKYIYEDLINELLT